MSCRTKLTWQGKMVANKNIFIINQDVLGDYNEESEKPRKNHFRKSHYLFTFWDLELYRTFLGPHLNLHSLTFRCLLILECQNEHKVIVWATSNFYYRVTKLVCVHQHVSSLVLQRNRACYLKTAHWQPRIVYLY